MKGLLSIALLTSGMLCGMQPTQIAKQNILPNNRLGNFSVLHDIDGFKIKNEHGLYPVKPWNMDKELRNLSQPNLAKVITANSYLTVNEVYGNKGVDYSLKINHRLPGGGLGGAVLGWIGGVVVTVFLKGFQSSVSSPYEQHAVANSLWSDALKNGAAGAAAGGFSIPF